jgi:hypothetical protein
VAAAGAGNRFTLNASTLTGAMSPVKETVQ